MAYFISRLIYKVVLKLLFRFEVHGGENLPAKGPFIVAANHVSYIDPIIMGVACHTVPLRFMAKKELFSKPVIGQWCSAVGCIPIERYSGSSGPLKKSLKVLKDGQALGIFPEGTRSNDGELKKAEPGIGIIAEKSGASVIPMYISGTREALPIGRKLPRLCKIKANIGKPVYLGGKDRISDKRKRYEFIGERVMETIASLKRACTQKR